MSNAMRLAIKDFKWVFIYMSLDKMNQTAACFFMVSVQHCWQSFHKNVKKTLTFDKDKTYI